MQKKELVEAIAEKAGLTGKDAEAALDGLIQAVKEGLKENRDKPVLAGFGTFEVRSRAAKKGINPRTKQEIEIPTTKLPIFKGGKANEKGGEDKLE